MQWAIIGIHTEKPSDGNCLYMMLATYQTVRFLLSQCMDMLRNSSLPSHLRVLQSTNTFMRCTFVWDGTKQQL